MLSARNHLVTFFPFQLPPPHSQPQATTPLSIALHPSWRLTWYSIPIAAQQANSLPRAPQGV